MDSSSGTGRVDAAENITEARYDVLVVGNATVDYVLAIPGVLVSGRKQAADSLRRYVGGEATNACLVMSALGLRTNFVGRFGSDDDGAAHLTYLHEHGCGTEGSVVVPGTSHHFAAVMVDPVGERTIVTRKDPALTPAPDQLPASLLRRCRALFSDGREEAFTGHALRLARDLQVRTFVDAEDAEWLEPVLPDIHELIVPGHVATQLAGRRRVDEAAAALGAAGPDVVVVTRGAAGAIVAGRHGRLDTVPAHPARVEDTTGAGDAFHGCYVAARLAGRTPADAVALAVTAGAITCEYPGPRAPADVLAQRCRPAPGEPADEITNFT